MKINVGCGWECRDGWINADNTSKPQRSNYPIEFMDATTPWPYADNTFDAVLSEHMIEHLPEEKGLAFLQQAYAKLKEGGVIRVSCPERGFFESLPGKDDHPFVKAYVSKIYKRTSRGGDAALISKRTLTEQGHVWVPYAEQLKNQLKLAGFRFVQQMEFGKSSFEEFDGIELEDGFGADIRKWESVCVEGVKT